MEIEDKRSGTPPKKSQDKNTPSPHLMRILAPEKNFVMQNLLDGVSQNMNQIVTHFSIVSWLQSDSDMPII